jgi:hypothetical protein
MRRATGVLVLAALLAVAGGGVTAGAAAASASGWRGPPRRGVAAYEWHTATDLPIVEVRQRLDFMRASGFRTVYLELSDYLEAADLPEDTPGRQERLNQIRRAIRRFVATAASLGLEVHALGGGPSWIGELSYLGRLLVRLVGRYNTMVRPKERLKGVQLDIEPYADPEWLRGGETAFVEYLDTLHGIVRAYRPLRFQHANRHLQLGFAIPFWFDAEGDAPGPVRFHGAVKPVAHHIIDMVRRLYRAYLVVMSYRNFTDGEDGSIAHARDEFDYASEIGARCGLVVGQEYADVEPARITFHGFSRSEFQQAADAITDAFEGYRQFRGLSVDDLDSYMAALP